MTTLRELLVLVAHITRRKHWLLVFTLLVLTSLSTLSLLALGSIKSMASIFDAFYPLGERDVVTFIVSSNAISPFTSIVNATDVYRRLGGIQGVEVIPVFVTIGLVDDKPYVIYEVNSTVDSCAYPDRDILEYAEKKWSGYIPVYSVFTERTVFLRICGIGVKPGIGVNHDTIARIRGVPLDYYSFLVVKIHDKDKVRDVLRALTPGVDVDTSTLGKLIQRAILVAVRTGRNTSITGVENPTQLFLERLGIQRDYVVHFAYFTALASLISLPLLGVGLIEALRRDTRVFTVIGVSKTSMATSLILLLGVLAYLPGVINLVLLRGKTTPGIEFLGYSPPLTLDPWDTLVVSTVQFVLCSTGVLLRARAIEA